MLQPTGTPDSPLPIQFSVPEEEFNAALAEMQSFSTDHLRECDEKALRFLTKADDEATAVAGKHDLMVCSELTGTLAERSTQFANAHAYRSASLDLLKTRYEQEKTRLQPTPAGPMMNTMGTPYAMLLNALDGQSVYDATMEKRRVLLPGGANMAFPRIDDGITKPYEFGIGGVENALATTSTMGQGAERGPLSVTYLLPRMYIGPLFRTVVASDGVSAITIPITDEPTNAAAVVAEGATVPESDIQTTPKTFTLQKIATRKTVTEQSLKQREYVQQLINYDLPIMIRRKVDEELWNSIKVLTGVLSQDVTVTSGKITNGYQDVVRAATKILIGALIEAEMVAVSPQTWNEMLFDAAGATLNSNFIDPRAAIPARIFGLPVYTPPGLFELIGAANNKLGFVCNATMFSWWWTQGGIELEMGLSGTQFDEYKQTYRCGIDSVFVNTQSKAFCLLNQKA